MSPHRLIARLAPLVALLALTACGDFAKFDYTRPFSRDFWQRPERVVHALSLSPGDTVADIGAGEGYFLPHLSAAVGREGQVIAVEISEELIAELFARVKREGLDNVRIVRGEPDDPRLPEGEVNAVLLVNTYHHIQEREGYFASLRGALAPGARLVIVDPNADLSGPLRMSLSEGHWSRAAEVASELAAAGYERVESRPVLPRQVLEIFVESPRDR